MNNTVFAAVAIGWTLLVVIGLVFGYRTQKKRDEEQEREWIEADAEYDEWIAESAQRRIAERRAKGPVFGLEKGHEKGFSDRYRKAESLGFIDPNDLPRPAS